MGLENTNKLLARLSPEQLVAATHEPGTPQIIISGAGSGKTTTLVSRVGWLHDVRGNVPRRTLVITFTNAAANELRERLCINPQDSNIPRVSTIHSLALSAIKKQPRGFGLADRVTPLDDYDQSKMLEDIVDRMKFKDMVDRWSLKEKMEYHRARGVGFMNEYTQEVHRAAQRAHAGYHALSEADLEVWRAYEVEKTKNSVVDFTDMLVLVSRRAKNDEIWRLKAQNMFDFFLIDEYQDTSRTQVDLIECLISPSCRDITMVGDISQSIYGFNGAAPEILFGFTKQWRDTVPKVYKLEDNYRSVPEVVKYANIIQSKMVDTVPLKMNSKRGENGETGVVKILRGSMARDIAQDIAKQIVAAYERKRDHLPYKAHALLVRAGSQISDIETELVRYRIPYVIEGGKGLMQTEEVRDMLAYMKFLVNPRDFMALTRSISIPKRGVGEKSLEQFKEFADTKHGGDMLAAGLAYKHPKMSIFFGDIAALKEETNPIKVLAKVIKLTKYPIYLGEKYKKEPEKVMTKMGNLDRLAEIFAGILERDPSLTIDDIIFQLSMNETGGYRTPEEADAGRVVISTIHKAKGREYSHVYVTNVVEDSIPHKWASTPAEVEEELRLFYVACTRAKNYLALCVPGMVQYGPNTRALVPSRFLAATIPGFR